jgi:hypothetical protein
MRAPARTLALTAAVIAAAALGGCEGSGEAASSGTPTASPATTAATPPTSAAPTPTRTRPALAGPGTTCGKLTTPGKYAARIVLARGHMACASAVQVVKRYYRGVRAGHGGGNTAALRVGRFFCQSTTAAGAAGGHLGSCDTANRKPLIKIEAQTDTD